MVINELGVKMKTVSTISVPFSNRPAGIVSPRRRWTRRRNQSNWVWCQQKTGNKKETRNMKKKKSESKVARKISGKKQTRQTLIYNSKQKLNTIIFFFYQPLMKVWNNPSHDFLKQERVRTSFLTRVSFVLQFYIYFVLKCGGHGQSDFGASCP